jgi:stage II sporulation protein AA (anti-sigma F factor antagonist)
MKGTNSLVTKISGELDHHMAKAIRTETDKRIMRGNIKNLIFDFNDLHFMDSSGIGVVIGRYKLISSLGGKLTIISSKANVNKILNMSGIPKIADIYPSLAEINENA